MVQRERRYPGQAKLQFRARTPTGRRRTHRSCLLSRAALPRWRGGREPGRRPPRCPWRWNGLGPHPHRRHSNLPGSRPPPSRNRRALGRAAGNRGRRLRAEVRRRRRGAGDHPREVRDSRAGGPEGHSRSPRLAVQGLHRPEGVSDPQARGRMGGCRPAPDRGSVRVPCVVAPVGVQEPSAREDDRGIRGQRRRDRSSPSAL